jgi:myo-inositol-1(or 4)-monophosphatase
VKEAGGLVDALTPDGDILAEGEVICANEAVFNSFAKVIRG